MNNVSSHNIIPCTLWGDLGKDFMTYYNSKSDDGPMVIIIKHAHIWEPKGTQLFHITIYCYEFVQLKYCFPMICSLTYHSFIGLFDLTISNAWSGTKLVLDPQLKEITEFTQRLYHIQIVYHFYDSLFCIYLSVRWLVFVSIISVCLKVLQLPLKLTNLTGFAIFSSTKIYI
jgi:hypothetical protein